VRDLPDTQGFFEGDALRVYGRLANLLVPDPRAREVAAELIDVITDGRAHPADVVEAYAVQAEVLSQIGTLAEAMAAANELVDLAEQICFHGESATAEFAIAERLTMNGDLDRAHVWMERGQHRTDEDVPGHVHLWNVRMNDAGEWEEVDEEDEVSGPAYESFEGRQPGAAR